MSINSYKTLIFIQSFKKTNNFFKKMKYKKMIMVLKEEWK